MTTQCGSQPRRLLALAVLAVLCGCAVAVTFGFAGAAVSDARPAVRAGEDSPWPRTEALRPNVRTARRELERLEEQVELMEQSAENYEAWQTCLTYVPVNELGDRDQQFGYLYDDRDGTGVGYMDALAVDRRRRWGKEDYLFIHFRGDGCRTDNPQAGGTAEPASVRGANSGTAEPASVRAAKSGTAESASVRTASGRAGARHGFKRRVGMLERKADRLFRRSQRLEAVSERFDEWESCVSWVPVTEFGDPDQKFGYRFGSQGSTAGYRTALHVDRSDWDDPDYMFLALVGGDRPGQTCQDEPGEAVD